MNRRWEVSEEILGTLVLNSTDAIVTNNTTGTNPTTTTQIAYTWNIDDWGFVFNHNSTPGDKWHCTHEYQGDYGAPPNAVVSQPFLAVQVTGQWQNIISTGYLQPYLMYSNLSGPSWDSTTGGTGFLNIAKANPQLSMYWTTVASASLLVPRSADPRPFIINNPEGIKQIRILFASNNTAPYNNGWTCPTGQSVSTQGSDYFTAGKHIFTFRKLKFL